MPGSSCFNSDTMVGVHPSFVAVRTFARRAGESELPVLVTGESGTGKELIAREIHDCSPRAEAPFVVVDCGMLGKEMGRSELFGHVRGAFTGATDSRPGLVGVAQGGTLFFDEVGELDEPLQRQLLRLIQEGEYRMVGDHRWKSAGVRVVAATNRELKQGVAAGRFRNDLYFRLRVIQLHLPPLRERRSDIPLLVAHFLERFARVGKAACGMSPETFALLEGYDWPGNIRELAHAIAGAQALTEGDVIGPDDLPAELRDTEKGPDRGIYNLPYKDARRICMDGFTKEYLHRALVSTDGNVSRAALKSGIGRQYFQLRMSEHGMTAAQYRRRLYDAHADAGEEDSGKQPD